MNKSLLAFTLAISLAFALVSPSLAQTPIPPRTVTITGQIVNGTPGGTVLANSSVLLHAWDQERETVMLGGTADSSGKFRFDNVPIQDGWVFAVMLNYQNMTFLSTPAEAKPETKTLTLPLTIYESTTDSSTVSVSQIHTFLDFVPGKLTVGEIYILSNSGDRAVIGGLKLANGKTATLQFALPEGAQEVNFEDEDPNRFIITPGGFADTGSINPGKGTTRVTVTYSLPYASGMTFAHKVNQPTESVNVLLRTDSGVTAAGDEVSLLTTRTMQTGETFNVYTTNSRSAGTLIAVTLTGKPNYYVPPATTNSTTNKTNSTTTTSSSTLVPNTFENRWGITVSAGMLGAAMIVAGLWWWKRNKDIEDEQENENDDDNDN